MFQPLPDDVPAVDAPVTPQHLTAPNAPYFEANEKVLVYRFCEPAFYPTLVYEQVK